MKSPVAEPFWSNIQVILFLVVGPLSWGGGATRPFSNTLTRFIDPGSFLEDPVGFKKKNPVNPEHIM